MLFWNYLARSSGQQKKSCSRSGKRKESVSRSRYRSKRKKNNSRSRKRPRSRSNDRKKKSVSKSRDRSEKGPPKKSRSNRSKSPAKSRSLSGRGDREKSSKKENGKIDRSESGEMKNKATQSRDWKRSTFDPAVGGWARTPASLQKSFDTLWHVWLDLPKWMLRMRVCKEVLLLSGFSLGEQGNVYRARRAHSFAVASCFTPGADHHCSEKVRECQWTRSSKLTCWKFSSTFCNFHADWHLFFFGGQSIRLELGRQICWCRLRKSSRRGISLQPLGLPCLEMSSCPEAVLSPSFQANFKHIGGGAKRAKEARTLYISWNDFQSTTLLPGLLVSILG